MTVPKLFSHVHRLSLAINHKEFTYKKEARLNTLAAIITHLPGIEHELLSC